MKIKSNMRRYLILTTIFALLNFPYLFAQERVNFLEDAKQHYSQGKEFYSEGRYEEATAEFQKALQLISRPRLQFVEQTREAEQNVLTPPTPSTPSTTVPTQKLSEKKQKEEQKTEIAKQQIAEPEKPAPNVAEREYYIDFGDTLDISVWQIPDLSKPEVIIRPDGKISFPLIGEITAQGMTLSQLTNIITEKLKVYVKAPQVSIMIRRFGEQGNKVVVLGEIISPGVYKFSSPPSIVDVIASAGGYTKYAVLNSIMVISGDMRAKPTVTRVNLAQVLKSGKITENIFLKPNDIVYVPRSFIGKVNVLLDVFQPAVNEYMQTLDIRHLQDVIRAKTSL